MEVELILKIFAVPFALGFSTLLLLYWNSVRRHKYWKEKGVIYDEPLPLLGSLLPLFTKPAHDVELERYEKYGKLYGHYEGNIPVLSVGDPLLLKDILVKDFYAFTGRRNFETGNPIVDKMVSLLKGEDWKRIRSIISPTFTTGKIKKMVDIFKDCSKTCVDNFKKFAKDGTPVDVKKFYSAFAMDVIASSAFSIKLDSHNDPENKFVKAARKVLTTKLSWRIVIFLMLPQLMRFFKICLFPPSGINFFRDASLEMIKERKQTGKTKNDLLQLLMDTSKEIQEQEEENPVKENLTANYEKEDSNGAVFKNVSKKALSHDELVAQCIIFFLAGYDTTASTISYATYLLALNPDVQEKLIYEIDEVLKDTQGEITYEALQCMKYLDNVISETLRLYTPVIRFERMATEDYVLEDTGIKIPKDMTVTIPIYAMHRDPTVFPNPEKFDPDRFNSEERAKRSQYSYMPFGAGLRYCIGMRFALIQIKVCLATILSNFKISRCPQTQAPLEFYIGQQLLQAKNITVEMQIRNEDNKVPFI